MFCTGRAIAILYGKDYCNFVREGLLQFWPSKAVIGQSFPKLCYIFCSSLPFTLPTKTIVSQPEDGSSTSFRKLGQSLAIQFETAINKTLTYTKLRPWKPEKLCKWPYHWTYCMSYWGRQMALIVWSGVVKQQGVTALYKEGMCIHFRYSAFCINFMYIIGRTDLINFRCLAILLAQQAVRYVKQSKQSALISSNVACCCWDISLIELSKTCYCSN